MTPSIPVALWLVPAWAWRERFATLIVELADEFDADVFEPHITLHVGALRDSPEVSDRLAAAAATHSPMTLVCGGTLHDSEHFRTLFVPFDDLRVHDLCAALVDAIDLRGAYELRPHLSLLYRGGLDGRERVRLSAAHRFDGEGVTFDEVVLARPGAGSGDLFDIPRLDTRERHRLIGSR